MVRAGADIDQSTRAIDQRRQNVGREHINREDAGNSRLRLHPRRRAIADACIVDYRVEATELVDLVGNGPRPGDGREVPGDCSQGARRRRDGVATSGVGNTGSSMSNGSGDYALAFATAEAVRRTPDRRGGATIIEDLPNDKISPLFQAVAEATEEAVYNAMLQATSTTGVDDHRLEALPLDRLKEILARHGIGTPTK